MELIGSYLIPILYIYFAWRFLKRPAKFGDTQGGFSAGRAKEREEIWDYAQKAAGYYCVTAGVGLAVVIYAATSGAEESVGPLYWAGVGLGVVSILLFVPAVCLIVDRKFPK